jgi:23S rRNA pseudouridine1911/1915/1917 synthase
VVVNKPAGMPCVPDKTEDKSLLEISMAYTKTHLHPVHRIDRPVSGLVLFAKNNRSMNALSAQFSAGEAQRSYLAITQIPLTENGVLVHHLIHSPKNNKVYLTTEPDEKSKESTLSWKKLAQSDRYALIEVTLGSGRHHQIRAQLAEAGMSVKGDVKYGDRRGNPDRSIHLHAWKMGIKHPVTGDLIEMVAPIPENDVLWTFFKEKLSL